MSCDLTTPLKNHHPGFGVPCSRYGNTFTRISETTAVLYGGNTFGSSGWANGDCWLLDLDKAKKLAHINPDKAKELIDIDLDRAKDHISVNLNKIKDLINIDLSKIKEIIDVNLNKAKVNINTDLDKAEQIMEPTSIWTPVSSHIHLPRVQHRDATFTVFPLLLAMAADATSNKCLIFHVVSTFFRYFVEDYTM